MKNRITVVGYKGFIGSEVFFRLKLMGLEPVGVDKNDLLKESDVVIHLASNIHGINKKDFEDEIELTLKIIEKTNKKIIFISSAAVYGNSKTPNREDQELAPINEYGKTKAFIESMIKNSFNESYSILRLANVYNRHAQHGVVANFLRGGYALYAKGERVRDYIHLEDVVRVIIEATVTDKWNGTYNIGTGVGTLTKDLFKRLSDKKPVFKDKAEINYSVMDITKAKRNGFNPFTF